MIIFTLRTIYFGYCKNITSCMSSFIFISGVYNFAKSITYWVESNKPTLFE